MSINSLPTHTAILIQTKRMSSRQVIARGQTTIYIQKDSYTISQSLGEYVFPADHSGKVLSAVSLTSTIKVTCGDSEYKDFTIGVIVKPAGFSSISVDNSRKTVTYTVATGTTTLAEHGSLDIPVTIAGRFTACRSSGRKRKPVRRALPVPMPTCWTGYGNGIPVKRLSTAILSSRRNSLPV